MNTTEILTMIYKTWLFEIGYPNGTASAGVSPEKMLQELLNKAKLEAQSIKENAPF